MEVERWCTNNKASEEEKYIDLYESLKKNDVIKDFVHRTLVEKVGEVRTVRRIIEVMTEKYSKTKSEKILELMRKISCFKMDDNMETLIDRFEELITEVDKEKLAENLKYALSSQFVDRLEKEKNINTGKKLRLKDVMEDDDRKPKIGNIPQFIKKELVKMKVAENREEVFTTREYTMNYVGNNEWRSRYNNWRNSLNSRGYVRS